MKDKREYSVWGMVKDKPIYLLLDGENFMSFEVAIERVFKYISSLTDTFDWKEIAPKGLEAMRWENGNGDRILISEVVQNKIMNSN